MEIDFRNSTGGIERDLGSLENGPASAAVCVEHHAHPSAARAEDEEGNTKSGREFRAREVERGQHADGEMRGGAGRYLEAALLFSGKDGEPIYWHALVEPGFVGR